MSCETIKFNQTQTPDNLHTDIRRHVDEYFERTKQKPQDSKRLYLKATIILLWLFASYVLLVFYVSTWWQAVPCCIMLGLAMASVGFCIQHDGGHKAFSKYQWVNSLAAMCLDLLGGSSHLWNVKHNQIHHTYTNVDEHDDDIDVGFLGRLSPNQRRFWFHRGQHIYLWLLYGFLTIKWQLLDDYLTLIKGRIGQHRFKRPRGFDLVIFIMGKVVFTTLAFAIPLMYHKFWYVLFAYLITSWCMGVVLAVVFQLAHVVEEAEFALPNGAGQMQRTWAEQQVLSTVDFSPRNRVLAWLLTWFLGGLNFQVEHHLCPKITHIHYPKLAPIIKSVCERHGLRHNSNTLLQAICSHYRFLRAMGRPV